MGRKDNRRYSYEIDKKLNVLLDRYKIRNDSNSQIKLGEYKVSAFPPELAIILVVV